MNTALVSDNFSTSQITRKKVCTSPGGIVAAQHRLAARNWGVDFGKGWQRR